MPVTVTGPSASGAMAASVMKVSEMLPMSTSKPPVRRPSGRPVTVVADSVISTSAPVRRSTSTKPRSPWELPVPRPGTVTRRPVTAAAAKK